METGFCDRVRSLDIEAQPAAGAVSTFVTIMQGCNNFCAYCVVPHLRGQGGEPAPAGDPPGGRDAGRPRDPGGDAPGAEREFLRADAPGEGPISRELIGAIGEVAGIERIRFTTSHPKDLSPRLIACFGEVGSLCEHIHLPVQSGSDRVLGRMNRGYTAAAYREKVAALREACPEISITSDVIVGFPGEEERDFQADAGADAGDPV